MSAVTIFVEGGGNSSATKTALRNGMDKFLGKPKNAARARSWRWNLVFCGNRNNAYDKFNMARNDDDSSVVILLVDSEGPVNALPCDHLTNLDGWDLSGLNDDRIHLMVQVMETWMVADPEALAAYYGQGFRANALPTRQDLEEKSKVEIVDALKRATEGTQKGRYHKTAHADLLAWIDPEKSRQRCRHCMRLFETLGAAIEAG